MLETKRPPLADRIDLWIDQLAERSPRAALVATVAVAALMSLAGTLAIGTLIYLAVVG